MAPRADLSRTVTRDVWTSPSHIASRCDPIPLTALGSPKYGPVELDPRARPITARLALS